MQLSDTLYAIHGTLDVDSIEANESEGCIRMLKEDVEELFDLVPMGTVVKIREGSARGPVDAERSFQAQACPGADQPGQGVSLAGLRLGDHYQNNNQDNKKSDAGAYP